MFYQKKTWITLQIFKYVNIQAVFHAVIVRYLIFSSFASVTYFECLSTSRLVLIEHKRTYLDLYTLNTYVSNIWHFYVPEINNGLLWICVYKIQIAVKCSRQWSRYDGSKNIKKPQLLPNLTIYVSFIKFRHTNKSHIGKHSKTEKYFI